ncbi:MAG: flagellar hook-associated protein 1 FlgK [Cycloclasticus sp.]|jgi:flagellar hook-associated protein 1 FlgK
MAGDLLLTGLSGLTAFKNVLNTTSQNIANVATEGYSRQRVDLEARNPQLTGAGFIGSGVTTTTITRSYDTFLSSQFRTSSSAASELDAYFNFATQVDGALANQNVGLSTALQDFFNAVQAVADDPTSIPARQVLLTEGEVLENRFSTLDNLFNDLTTQLNGSLQTNVSTINNLSKSIATLNDKIVTATGLAGGQPPNDLLDQRDLLVDRLSELTNVNTNVQENGALNVFIGNGQSLVLGSTVNTLALQPAGFDPGAVDIVFKQGSNNLIVTQFMSGGEIGGTLRFRDEVLDPAINTLGQVAVGLAFAVNEQHANGIDLDGQQGLNFFSEPTVAPIQLSGTGSLAVDITNPADITNSDYSLTYDGATYSVRRLSDDTITTIADGDTVDGMTFDLSSVVSGDVYRIRPTREAAYNFSLALSNPRDIAAALPVVGETATTNSGTASLSGITINNLAAAALPAPQEVTLDYNAGVYTVGGGSPATLAYDAATNSGDTYTVNVAGFGDISFTLSGQPDDGDTFALVDNAGGIGDNRNALLLAGLQTTRVLSGGTATFQDTYGQVVADVGRRTQAAELNGAAQKGLLAQTIAAKESVSGVSLDEEAANLIRFQQAYQAASQVVLTSRTIFDTLIGVFR